MKGAPKLKFITILSNLIEFFLKIYLLSNSLSFFVCARFQAKRERFLRNVPVWEKVCNNYFDCQVFYSFVRMGGKRAQVFPCIQISAENACNMQILHELDNMMMIRVNNYEMLLLRYFTVDWNFLVGSNNGVLVFLWRPSLVAVPLLFLLLLACHFSR